MKRLLIPASLLILIVLGGCFTETIDAFSTFTFELSIPFRSDHSKRSVPDTSIDFTNLNKHSEYKDNKSKIEKALIKEFNYWIDYLEFVHPETLDTLVFNPMDTTMPKIQFDYIKFYLQFGKIKDEVLEEYMPKNLTPEEKAEWIEGFQIENHDSSFYEIDTTEDKHLLGAFYDVDIKDYFREPKHIETVESTTSQIISDAVKNRPAFYIVTEYSHLYDQAPTDPERFFPFVKARYDMIIKFEVNL